MRGPLLVLSGLLVGVALGVAGMTLFSAKPAAATDSSSALASTVPTSEAAPVTTRAQKADADARGSAPVELQRTELPAGSRTTAAVPRSENLEQLGSLVIEGTVTDDEGAPLSGVAVRAQFYERAFRAKPSEFGKGLDPQESLDELIEQTVEAYRRRQEDIVVAETGSDGRYRIEGLRAGRYIVVAGREGYALRARNGTDRWVLAGTTLNYRASPVVTIPVQITRVDGVPVREATLKVVTQEHEDILTHSPGFLWKATDPFLRVAPDTYKVQAMIDAAHALDLGMEGEWISDSETVFLRSGQPAPALQFVLAPQMGVRGVVQVPDDLSINQVQVKLVRLEPGEAFDHEAQWKREAVRENMWVSRYNGWEYALLDVPPGRYALLAFEYENRIAFGEAVELTDRVVSLNLVMPAVVQGRQAVVHVTDQQGRPVSGVEEFTYRYSHGNGSGSGILSGDQQAPGEYHFQPESGLWAILSGEEEGTASLSADAGERGHGVTELARGRWEYSIVLIEPARLVLTVSGLGNLAEGRAVQATLHDVDRDGSARFVGSEVVGTSGEVAFDPMPPGTYQLQIALRRSRGAAYRSDNTVVTQELILAAGVNRVAVSLPTMHALVVRFPRDAVVSGASLVGSDESRRDASMEGGLASFAELLPGRYTLRAWGGLPGQMTIDIPAVRDVTFQADPVDCVRVALSERPGWLQRYGFKDGDKIIAIAGKEFSSEAEWKVAWSTLLGTDMATFTVLRGGRTVTLEVDAKVALNEHAGGSLELEAR